jgi:hypothetical protein
VIIEICASNQWPEMLFWGSIEYAEKMASALSEDQLSEVRDRVLRSWLEQSYPAGVA